MAAVRALVLALAVAACAGPAPAAHVADPPAEPTSEATAPASETREPTTDAPGPPPECGRDSWRACLSAADSMIEQAPAYQLRAVQIYKLLCVEGDRRRCFEADTPATVRERCAADGLVAACADLAQLYRTGRATCPEDDSCADVLFQMACKGGDEASCVP